MEDEMLYEEKIIETIPVGPLGLIPLKSCAALGEKVDRYQMCIRDRHRSAFIVVPIARPRTPRSKQSKIADTYSFPSDAGISVISVIHFSNGESEWKSRFNRSSDFMASRSAFVIPFGFLFG